MGTLQSVQWREGASMCQKSFHLQRGHQNFNALQKKGPKFFCFQQLSSTLPQQILYDRSLKETFFFGQEKYLKFSINQIVGPIIDGLTYSKLKISQRKLSCRRVPRFSFSYNEPKQKPTGNYGQYWKIKKKKRFKNFMVTFYR